MFDVDILESQRLEMQLRLDAMKTQGERNKLGQFSTPTELALDILKYAQSLLPLDANLRFLDPAFGTGSFFSALLKTFSPSQLIETVGYEIDPLYRNEAAYLWSSKGLDLHLADFTCAAPHSEAHKRANLLICNPPYVRHHHLSKEKKQQIQKIGEKVTGIALSEQSGLYAHFIFISHIWMAEGCLAGWLIPGEFMDVRYGQQIKQYLLEKVTLLRVHRFNPKDVQFHDALVSSSIVWFINVPPSENHEVEFTYGGTLEKPERSTFINSNELTHVTKWSKFFLPPKEIFNTEAANIETIVREVTINIDFGAVAEKKAATADLVLDELFDVKRGLATGANDFFLLDQEQISKYQLPEEFIMPILPAPRHLSCDEVFSDKQGQPIVRHRLFLLSCNISEAEVRAGYPFLWRYLQMGMERGIDKGYLCRSRKLWYQQEKRPASMFLCAYMGRQSDEKETPFRFILNHSIATATNGYHILYPKPFLTKALLDNPEMVNALWKALQAIPADILIGEGRVYGGGLHKVEPKELATVPAHGVLALLQSYAISVPDKAPLNSQKMEKRKEKPEEHSLWDYCSVS